MPALAPAPDTEDTPDAVRDRYSPGGPAENGAGPFPVLSLDNLPTADASSTVAPVKGPDPAPAADPTPAPAATPDPTPPPATAAPAPDENQPAADPYANAGPRLDQHGEASQDPDTDAKARADEEAQDHFRKLFTDDSYLKWTADDPAVNAAAAANPDPNSVQIRGADQAYLAFRLGVPAGRLSGAAYTAQRDGYARAHFGRQGGVTDHEFFGLVRGEMQGEIEEEKAYGAVPEVIVSGWMEGLADGRVPSNAEMMTRWRSQYPNLRLDAGEEARLMAAAQQAAQPVYDFLSKYGRQAKLAYDTLKNFTDGKTTQPDGRILSDGQVLSDLATQLGTMPDEARRQLYGYIGLYAQSQATTPEGKAEAAKLWAKQFGESISRSITETAGAGSLYYQQAGLEEELAGLQGRPVVQYSAGPGAITFNHPPDLSPEEKAAKIARIQGDLRQVQIVRELRAVAAGQIDPAREISKGWLGMAQKASYVAGSSLPYVAATVASPTIGISLIAAATSVSETNRILLEYPKLSFAQAQILGAISGTAQTATMALTARLMVGRMPATAAFLKSLEKPAASMPELLRGTALKTGIAMIEGGVQTEIGLATPMVVERLAKAMGMDLPGYDFRKKLAEFLSPDTQITALVPIMTIVAVSSGLAGLKDIKPFREIRQNPAKLSATFGIDAESARRVAEAPDDQKDAILREAMARVSPETNRKIGEEAEQAAERAQAMQAAPDKPTINTLTTPDGGTHYSVEGKPGKEIYLTQDQDAALMAHGEALRQAEQEKASVEAAPPTAKGQAEVNPAEGQPATDGKAPAGSSEEPQPVATDNQGSGEPVGEKQAPKSEAATENPYRNATGKLKISGSAPRGRAPELAGYEAKMKSIADDPATSDAIYNELEGTFGGKVIGTDLYRDLLPEYAAGREGRIKYMEATGRVASAAAKDRLWRELTNPGGRKKLVLTAGGVAAGKSTAIGRNVVEKADLVFDGLPRNSRWAIDTIRLARQHGWDVQIEYVQRPMEHVIPGAIDRAQKEGRWGSLSELPEVHQKSQKSILQIADAFEGDNGVEIWYWRNAGTDTNPRPAERLERADIDAGGEHSYDDNDDSGGTHEQRERGLAGGSGQSLQRSFPERWQGEVRAAFQRAVESGKYDPRILAKLAKGDPGLEGLLAEGEAAQKPAISETSGVPSEKVRARFSNLLTSDPSKVLDYFSKGRSVPKLSADDLMELSPEYASGPEGRRAYGSVLYPEAAKATDGAFHRLLSRPADPKKRTIVFTAGGASSGKSTAIASEHLPVDTEFVLDSTFSNPSRALGQVASALSAGRKVQVSYVARDFPEAVKGMLDRATGPGNGRVVDVGTMARTHAGAADTVAAALERYGADPRVRFEFYQFENDKVRHMSAEEFAAIQDRGVDTLRNEGENTLNALSNHDPKWQNDPVRRSILSASRPGRDEGHGRGEHSPHRRDE
jgi:hypothetical protein